MSEPLDDTDPEKFNRRLAERRAAREAEKKQSAPPPRLISPPDLGHDEDLIPDTDAGYEVTDADVEMDKIISAISVAEAYVTWCGKTMPDVSSGKRESIMVSCPIPGHTDTNPSAWLNLDKDTWFCGGCQVGGDAYDIAAYAKGFPVPGYKDGAEFHKLREQMAADFGYSITKLPGGAVIVNEPPVENLEPEPEIEYEDNIEELFDEGDLEVDHLSLDWRSITPADTFIYEYMKAVVIDDLPEEYHFFNALLALGFTLGRDVRLLDGNPVFGNLFVCALGRSGSGKSQAKKYLDNLLAAAMPSNWSDPNSKGVEIVSSPGSAEVMISSMQKPVEDPANPKKILYYAPVRGLFDFSELGALIARMSRVGSAIDTTILEFFDMSEIVSTRSLSTGVKKAYRPFASASTTTQPKSLKNLLTKANDSSGFLNRWLYISGTPKKRFSISTLVVDITPAVKPLQEILGWAASFKDGEYIEWSDEALFAFDKFFHDHIQPDKEKAPDDMLVRLDLMMKKLVLLFTANRKLRVVPIGAVDDMISCYDYIKAGYGIPSAQIGNTLGNEINEAILYHAQKLYKKNKSGFTLRDLSRSLARRKYPNDMLLKSVDSLVKLGQLTVSTPSAGKLGRPTVRYTYVA